MSSEFKPAPLFGGAMMAEVPATFEDVSDIRQIPDNQEVWLDAQGFSSIVFDILERVDKPTDLEAIQVHLSDIVEEDFSELRIWATGPAHFAKIPSEIPTYSLLATSPPGEKQRGRPNEPDVVGILLMLIRLVEQKTDIVISINVPHIPGSYDPQDLDLAKAKYGSLINAGMRAREKVLATFEIKDWNLFVQE